MTHPNPLPSKQVLDNALALWQQTGRQHTIPIQGQSMLPLLRDGDQAHVDHGATQLHRGDVIVFRLGTQLIVHRLLQIKAGPLFMAKGDNVRQPDPPVPAEAVLGRVIRVQRGQRSLRLDTFAWRVAGRLIAGVSLLWLVIYRWAQTTKQRLLGSKPTGLGRLLQAGATFIAKIFYGVVRLTVERWRV